MNFSILPLHRLLSLIGVLASTLSLTAQPPDQPADGGFPPGGGQPPFGPGGFGAGPGGFGPGGFGPGGPMQQEAKLLAQFDKDGDKRLNATERKAALEYLAQNPNGRRGGRGGPGGRFGRGGPGGPGGGEQQTATTPQPGEKLTPADVKTYGKESLYDGLTLRTLFFEFENNDWEKEMVAFYHSDVEVPAKLTVDGKAYPDVGVHFRGNTSFMMVSDGFKRPIGVSLDFVHDKQTLGGYRTLDLLNAHEDPTFLHNVLFAAVARDYIPTLKANFVRVVINGESWGVYINAQHFNKEFLQEAFGTTEGARWVVPGSPGGRGGFAYLGDDPAPYKNIYEIKSKDDKKSWAALIKLCKVLDQTPADKLEAAVAPLLDIDSTLKYLALDNVFTNGDGFWTRASDYNLYLDPTGRFHLVPHDTNETFSQGGGGPGGRGGPGGGRRGGPFGPGGGPGGNVGGRGFGGGPQAGGQQAGGLPRGGPQGGQLDPLVSATDTSKPLASKLLAVPALRARYLGYVRDIAEKWLDWSKLGAVAQQYHTLISADVEKDTHKLTSYEAFKAGLDGAPGAQPQQNFRGPGGGGVSLKTYAEQRRAYLLNYPAIKELAVK